MHLPDELGAKIYSYLPYETTCIASKRDAAQARYALCERDYPAIAAAPQGSFILKTALLHPLTDDLEGRAELVRRVRKAAIEAIGQNANKLTQSDRNYLSLSNGLVGLSLEQMSYALDRIENNGNDAALVAAFDQLFPAVADTILVPNDDNLMLINLAIAFRAWIRDPANAEAVAAVEDLNVDALPGGARELLEFPNLPIEQVLSLAIKGNQLDLVEEVLNDPRVFDVSLFLEDLLAPLESDVVALIVQSPRAIGEETLGRAFYAAAEAGDRELAQLIFNGDRVIGDEDVGDVLLTFAESGDWEMVEMILNGDRPIDPVNLALTIDELIEAGRLDLALSIINSPRPIDPVWLAKTLRKAISEEVEEIAVAILDSPRELNVIELAKCLKKAMQKGNYALFDLILYGPREMESIQLAFVVLEAVKTGHHAALAAIVDSQREIDPEQLIRSVRVATRMGDIQAVSLIRTSGRPLGRH